ncbi:MAG: DUF4188 domain-containing protein [Propionibacteriaceae bacterium]|nr:DUF4188 domain-containing protein [Micropruina sp.]HBX79911.1 DUF4188 domain-containing protein [Propionibacteriaceae bacterium]
MATITPGRWTHQHDGEVVVFLIGIRVNKITKVRAWLPAMAAMGPMISELAADPSLGLLGFTQHFNARGATMVQYWKDLDSLIAYAKGPESAHRPAWTEFNRRARKAAGAVGIWHETLVVPAGRHESLYIDMPSQGLPAALNPVEATGRRQGARGRIAASTP